MIPNHFTIPGNKGPRKVHRDDMTRSDLEWVAQQRRAEAQEAFEDAIRNVHELEALARTR